MQVMDNNSKTKRSDLITLVGASGSAKTSIMFLVASQRWCNYVEASTPKVVYGNGLVRLRSALESVDDPSEAMHRDIWSRGVALLVLWLCDVVKTPYDWLVAQIDDYCGYISRLFSSFRTVTDQLESLYSDLEKILGQRVGYIVDESQLLLKKYSGSWKTDKSSKGEWLFLDFYCYLLCSRPLTPIFIGTSFTIAHAISLVSPVAKITKPLQLYLIVDFPFLNEDEVVESVKSCLDLTGVEEAAIRQMGWMLFGRARWTG